MKIHVIIESRPLEPNTHFRRFIFRLLEKLGFRLSVDQLDEQEWKHLVGERYCCNYFSNFESEVDNLTSKLLED